MSHPLANNTSVHDVYHGWKPPPNVRGTTDIIFVCVTTIFLCVYSAIHLNIPPPGEKKRYQFLRKAKWVVVAILAPELALSVAWTQFAEARALCAELRRIHQEAAQKSETEEGIRDELPNADILDLTYAFYAVMGGFRIKVDDDPDSDYENHISKASLVVMPSTLVKFARAGVWWDIDRSTIMDKSKADNLAKTLVVFQLTWMCAQCTARAISGLPMTLLELHTFIHAVCAAIMFAIWFRKPLNVQEAMIKTVGPAHQFLQRGVITEARGFNDLDYTWGGRGIHPPLTDRRANYGFSSLLVKSESVRIYYFVTHAFTILAQALVGDIVGPASKISGYWLFASVVILIQAAYGGIHLTAWHFAFPSSVERWLWCGASIYIASFTPVLVLAMSLIDSMQTQKYDEFIFTSLGICMAGCTIISLCARSYIVIEAFVALRAVPIGVYEAVSWANYIPHI